MYELGEMALSLPKGLSVFNPSLYICLRKRIANHYSNLKWNFTKVAIPHYSPKITLTVAKAGGLQSQGVKGENVVGYLDPLTTQDLKFSGFPDVLGRSSKSEAQRVNNTGD